MMASSKSFKVQQEKSRTRGQGETKPPAPINFGENDFSSSWESLSENSYKSSDSSFDSKRRYSSYNSPSTMKNATNDSSGKTRNRRVSFTEDILGTIDEKSINGKSKKKVPFWYTRLVFAAVALLIFILLSSFFGTLVANNYSKNMVVSNGYLVVKGDTDEKVATKSFGTSAYAGLLNDDSSNTNNIHRLTASVAVDACKIEDFDSMMVSRYYRSSFTKKVCKELHSDAHKGARPAIILQVDGSVTTELGNLDTFKTAQYVGGGCDFINIWIGETETWYFRNCGDDICDWFVTPNREIPLPCCLTHITGIKKKEEYSPCECDSQCQSGLSCAYRYDGLDNQKVCTDITNTFYDPSPPDLKQDSFNNVGPMTEISKDFFKEVAKTLIVINAVQENHAFDRQDYNRLRDELEKAGDNNHETLFVKESGCLFSEKVRVSSIEEVCTPAKESRQSQDFHKAAQSLEGGVVEKFGDVCYGVFRRTISFGNPLKLNTFDPRQKIVDFTDWISSSLNRQTEYIVLNGQETCRVPRVFNRVFSEENELWGNNTDDEGMEKHIRSCAQTCVDTDGKNCTVVLGGHSEGGALAILAAIRIHDLNPVVINTGAPPAVYVGQNGLCPFLNQDRIFRFVAAQGINNTSESISPRNAILYDPIPQLTGRGIHMGSEFRVTDDSASSVAYFYGPRRPSIYANNYGDISIVQHYKDYYMPHLFNPMSDHFDNNTASTVQLGWENGLRCSHNDECQSSRCAWDIQYPRLLPHSPWGLHNLGRFCESRIEIGDQCLGSYECNVGRCMRNPKCINCPWICTELASKGESCIEDLDCESQRCNLENGGKFCRHQLDNGNVCNRMQDCISGRCDYNTSWPFLQSCIEKTVPSELPSNSPSADPSTDATSTVDSKNTHSVDLDSFEFYPFLDSDGGNIGRLSGGIEVYAQKCNINLVCLGFNSNGWYKSRLKQFSEWITWTDDPTLGFYKRKDYVNNFDLDEPPIYQYHSVTRTEQNRTVSKDSLVTRGINNGFKSSDKYGYKNKIQDKNQYDRSQDQCNGLNHHDCKIEGKVCNYSGKKKMKGVCEAKKTYKRECIKQTSSSLCNSVDNTGLCKWEDGVCSHKCDSLTKINCKKVKYLFTKQNMCTMPKITNPCYGCHPKTKC